MKTSLAGANATNRFRVFLIATCIIIAITPHLSADIILRSRLSDAAAWTAQPQSQTDFLPASLSNAASGCCGLTGCFGATSSSNSSIFINNGMEGLRVVGDGTANIYAQHPGGCGSARAKLILLSFYLTEVSYPYLITGQLNSSGATAKLTGETGTIFERDGTTTLSESGTLPPGNYTLSVEVHVVSGGFSDANFTFTLDGPMSTIPATHATNLSTRLLVGTGDNVGIGGFIIAGSHPRYLLFRGIGPTLGQFGIANRLGDPTLELHGPAGFTTITNNDWANNTPGQADAIIVTGRAPSDGHESAIVANLAPGAYTAILGGNAGETGDGLVEIYDLFPDQDSRLANISTRANVGTGGDIVIAGFILGGGSGGEGTIIVRGLGPSLSAFDVPNALADPRLELRDPNGTLLIGNNNWQDDPAQAAIISAAGLAPTDSMESAIAATLMPGPYTALLSGVNNGTGIGLVEVYDLGAPAN